MEYTLKQNLNKWTQPVNFKASILFFDFVVSYDISTNKAFLIITYLVQIPL